MISELGHFALCFALAIALFQAAIPVPAVCARLARAEAISSRAAIVQFALIAFAYGALTYAYVVSDFSVYNVYANSHSAKPLAYRLAGVWGNHEGSMLLWTLVLALFGALLATFTRRLSGDIKIAALGVHGALTSAFLAFLLFTSNPFMRLSPAPLEGLDLNPVLQDPGLIFHPPLLYIGYVGFSVTFSLAVAALISGRIDMAWGALVRPWALAAWIFLTLGIALGSFWAYYELGWGGFWFWDPVENASLLPWLAGAALLHCAIVVERREALKAWAVFLAIIAFAMSLLGTFLVRSGILTSVHAFASDPARGVFVLAIFAVSVGGALALFAWRAPALSAGGQFQNISREGALVVNNLLLSSAAATVLIGTLYPILLEAVTGDLISVGPPYFNSTLSILMAPLFLLMPFGPLLAWKRGDLPVAARRLFGAALAAFTVAALAGALTAGLKLATLAGLAAGAWLIFGALTDLANRAGLITGTTKSPLRRILGLPRGAIGAAAAHAGLGVTLIGIVLVSALQSEVLAVMRPGEAVGLGARTLRLERIETGIGANFDFERAHFTVETEGTEYSVASERRRYWTRDMETSEVGLLRFGLSHVYVVLGDTAGEGAYQVRAHGHPQVLLIWIGALVMAGGGLLSLSDRRVRIALPRRGSRAMAHAPSASHAPSAGVVP